MELTHRPDDVISGVERIVVASVGLTARAVTDVAPELTLGQWRVLVLVDRPGGLAVGSIASALGAKIAAVSRLVGRLQRRGLVATQRADFDARVVLVTLTSGGEALRNRIVERRRADLEAMLDHATLTPQKDVVERLAAALEASPA